MRCIDTLQNARQQFASNQSCLCSSDCVYMRLSNQSCCLTVGKSRKNQGKYLSCELANIRSRSSHQTEELLISKASHIGSKTDIRILLEC